MNNYFLLREIFNMEYYIFRCSRNEKVTGGIPQCERMSKGYYYGENSVWKVLFEKLDFIPDLDAFLLTKRAKVTDLIYAAPVGTEIRGNMLVSKKLFDIFSNYKLPQYQFFDAKVRKIALVYDYILMHFWENQNNFVDFQKSEFFLGSKHGSKISDLEFKDYGAYLSAREDMNVANKKAEIKDRKTIRLSKLVIDKEKVNLDFFRICNIGRYYVVNERLKNALEESGCTGFDLIDIDTLKIKVRLAS